MSILFWVLLGCAMTSADPGGQVHRPVMVERVLELLDPQPGQTLLDGTAGAGGHALALLPRLQPGGMLHGVDRDPNVLPLADAALRATGLPFALHHGNFGELERIPALAGLLFDGVLLDLGVSSLQLDQPERGFSFRHDGPLDMRMDPTRGATAAELVASCSERELADLIFQYGEERRSRRVARAIVREREQAPIQSTQRLAEIVRRAVGGRRGAVDAATRTFQALRIATNGELQILESGLNRLVERLSPGGRIAILSFHSLEDRIVKRAFAGLARSGEHELLTRKPLRPDEVELRRNRRSRSARLRALRRLL